MTFDHRIGRALFVLAVSVAVVLFTYRWVTNPEPRAQRQAEEAAVMAAREHLAEQVGTSDLELVDPLAPNRRVGKVYVYAEAPGWAVSGYYRRTDEDRWRPFLIYLTEDLGLHSYKSEESVDDLR